MSEAESRVVKVAKVGRFLVSDAGLTIMIFTFVAYAFMFGR